MYFKGVNRGISFTKSGTYVLGFVFLIGLLAGTSGYNALFLALAFGSGLLITSGLLSERSIKFFDAKIEEEKIAEANTVFRLPVRFRNRNAEIPLFGTEVVVARKIPKFRLFNPRFASLGAAHVLRLVPAEEKLVSVVCDGLPRGVYPHVPLIIRTLYPFGLITKFKLSKSKKELVIFPAKDVSLFQQLEREIRSGTVPGENQLEFHSHRLYANDDMARRIDWRKSAGKAPEQWQVKVFLKPTDRRSVVVRPDWTAQTAENLESFLSRIVTACDAIPESFPEVYLEVAKGKTFLKGRAAIKKYLAAFPLGATKAQKLPALPLLVLHVSHKSHRWEESHG